MATGKRFRVDTRAIRRRLDSLRKPGESEVAFAKRIHIERTALNGFKNGRNGLGVLSYAKIARSTGKSLDWLVLGR